MKRWEKRRVLGKRWKNAIFGVKIEEDMKRLLVFAFAVVMAVSCGKSINPGGNDAGKNGAENGENGENGGDDEGGENNGAKAGTYTFDFTAAGYENQEEVTDFRQDGIDLSFGKAAKWFDNGKALRVYSGTSFTLSAGKEITKVKFTFGENDSDNAITAIPGTFSTDEWTGAAGSVYFTVGGENGHRRIAQMTITLSSKNSQTGSDGGDGGEVTAGVDELNVYFTGVRKGGQYEVWSGKKGTASSAVYAGNTANFQDAAIQFNGKDGYGIVSTATGGKVRRVSVEWNTNTYEGAPRVLQAYGSNSAYKSPADLYQTGTCGTLLGSAAYPNVKGVSITGDYKYIGLRSEDGALYLNKIEITWE